MKSIKTSLVLVLSALALSACSESSSDSDVSCDYTAPKCNEGGTALLTCTDGTETMKICKCKDNACVDTPSETGCDYAAPKCNEGGTALLTCIDGVETAKTCECENGVCKSPALEKNCDWEGAKCSDDKKSLLTCRDSILTSTLCTCENNACTSVPSAQCSYTAPKCNDAGTALMTCTNGVESVKTCPCSKGACIGSDTPSAAVRVTGLEPTSGKKGTKVTISGNNLSKVTEVCFGSQCAAPSKVSDSAAEASAPEGSGDVKVTVKADSKVLTAGTFSYLQENDLVDWCQLTYVEPSIAADERVGAYAEVYEEGRTGSGSKHDGLTAQIGYVSASSDKVGDVLAWTWVDAERNKEFAGASAGANDEYMTSIKLEVGEYRVAYRFSLDKANWVYCDKDGSNNGFSVDQAGTFKVTKVPEPEKPTVGWCRIVNGETEMSAEVKKTSDAVYAQAFVKDCTHFETHCPTLKAQIGYGPKYASSEAELAKEFAWTDAKLNEAYDGSGGVKHDEFMGTVSAEKAGNYSILYRMSVDGGASWTYCDTSDDSTFNAADAISLTVADPGVTPEVPVKSVEWCRLWSPNSIEIRAGQETGLVFGRAFVDDCTGTAAGCKDLKAELGYGAADGKLADYTYTPAKFNASAYEVGNNDEYMANIKLAKAGDYAYVYRFSVDDGKTWTVCDTEGIVTDKAAKPGLLKVTENKDTVNWCRIQDPEVLVVEKDTESAAIYGQVFISGCSEGEKKCEGVSAQVGYGAKADEPSSYKYVDAEYNKAVVYGNNDEYMATIKPDKAGEYALVYRFKTKDDTDWTYCDFDNEAGFDKNKASKLTVKEPVEKKIEWCQFFTSEFPDNVISAVEGEESPRIYGQAFVKGCTEDPGVCAGLTAYIGYGPKDAKTPESYTFTEVSYVKNVGNNDEFAGSVSADAGTYGLLYAFSLDGGKTKVYCDSVDTMPYDMKNIATLSVGKDAVEGAPFVRGTDYSCGIDNSQAMLEIKTGQKKDIYGQIYIPDCTTKDGVCDKVVSANLYYIESFRSATNHLGYSSYWKTVPAVINPAYALTQNNDEYMAEIAFETPGSYNYAYGFELKHNPKDAGEKAQKVFCFIEWKEWGEGTINVTNP